MGLRGGLWLLLWAFLAGFGLEERGAVAAPNTPPVEPQVRVLLFREPSRVVVDGVQGTGRVEIVAVRGGLRADGGPPVESWSGGGSGVVTVRGLQVRGTLRVHRTEAGLAVVNQLPVESYLAGTLTQEMYAGWSAQALRAQAVASRTYALHQCRLRAGEIYDLAAGTASQVYGGVEAETSTARAAVEATRGEILTYRGAPILAAFHSASGGRTASAEEVWGEPKPYLVSLSVEDEWDSPDTYWRALVSGEALGRAAAALTGGTGEVHRATVTDRSESGRVREIRLEGERGAVSVSGRALRRALGQSILRSTLFQLSGGGGEDFLFVGSGRGHGVGMSQWGARAMARRGANYREILATFYPGTRLERFGAASCGRASSSGGRGRVGDAGLGGEPTQVSSTSPPPVGEPVSMGVGP